MAGRRARAICADRGLRLTPPRAFALEALLELHRAMTAYELLDRLRAAGLGAQPPVAYRALDFLVANGFAHRVERINAFVACMCADPDHAAGFVVCRVCRSVAEIDLADVSSVLEGDAEALGFSFEAATLEAIGVCGACQPGRA